MSRSESIVVGVVSTVVGGLLLAWIADWLPKLWAAAKFLGHWSWSVLAYEATLPVWALFLAGIVLLIAARASLSRSVSTTSTETRLPLLKVLPTAPELSPLEAQVVQLLAAADGKWLHLPEIARRLGKSNLHVEQALEALLNGGFLVDNHNYLHGTSFRLSSRGRDYAIQNRYV